MARRPFILMMTVAVAGMGVIGNGMSAIAATGETDAPAAASRLGSAILGDLKRRDADTADRTRALQLREQMVKATENRIQASLRAKQKAAAAVPAQPPEANPQPKAPDQIDSLATIYAAMKPAKAAAVFEQLDLDVQVMVAKRMKDRSTAAILTGMSPEAAARLSMALAGRRPTFKPVAAKVVAR